MVTIHGHPQPKLQRRVQPGTGRRTAELARATAVLAVSLGDPAEPAAGPTRD